MDKKDTREVSDHDINMYSVVIDANYPYNLKNIKGRKSRIYCEFISFI